MAKLSEIVEMWKVDSNLSRERLDEEGFKLGSLHSKYYEIFANERLLLTKYNIEMKELRLSKFEFLTQGPTKETRELGWELPPIGRILKADANQYVDVDKDVVNLTLKIGIQKEKIDMLESIIKMIMNRGFLIKNILDVLKFQTGF